MSGIILRWVGGAGGDTLCDLLSLQNTNLYMNVSYRGKIEPNTGRTLIKTRYDPDYPLLVRLAQGRCVGIDMELLGIDLCNLIKKHKRFVLASHLFNNDIGKYAEIIDLGFNLKFLPFIVQCNIEKTETISNNFTYNNSKFDSILKKISKKLSNKQMKQLVTWNLVKDNINLLNEFDLDNASLSVEDFFYNQKHIEVFFKEKGYDINLDVQFFSDWKKINTKYLPSKKYLEYVQNKQYNYNDTQLAISERYTLLALAGRNFTFMD